MPNLEMIAAKWLEEGDLLDDGDGWDRVLTIVWGGGKMYVTTESTKADDLDPMVFDADEPIWIYAKD